jgi:hypothetical protein
MAVPSLQTIAKSIGGGAAFRFLSVVLSIAPDGAVAALDIG